MIASVLIRSPQIILADEPANELDTAWASQVIRILQEQTRNGKALAFVPHDPNWALTAPLQYALYNGKLAK